MLKWNRIAFACASLVLSVAVSAAAQDTTCPALVDQALNDVGNNCADMNRNTACYGYNRVDATFFQQVAADVFSVPSDRTGLTDVESLQTAPLDVSAGTWGVALMNVQANVPNTLPGQAVIFMLVGDAQITNAVSPDAAFVPADPISTTVAVDSANVRSGPGSNTNVLGTLSNGSDVQADGKSADGQWYRIVYNGGPAWISKEVIATADGLAALPVISEADQTPMQAFYFSTGFGNPQCNEVPDSVVIQGPQGVKVDITANGANITIGSTIVLQSEDGTHIRLIVLHGYADINGLIVPGGFTVDAELDENGNVVPGSWTGFRPLTQDELNSFSGLENLDPNLLHYPITLPTQDEINQLIAAYQSGGAGAASRSTIEGVSCSGLLPTSPIGTMAYGVIPFYWNAASGADQYRLNIYGSDGSLRASYTTQGTETNIPNVDAGGAIGAGDNFSWEVQALKAGQVACSSGRASVTRGVNPNPIPAKPPFSASWTCDMNTGYLMLSFNNAFSGEAVTLHYTAYGTMPVTMTFTGPSGGAALSDYDYSAASISTASGESVGLPNMLCGG